MKTVYSERHRLQAGQAELFVMEGDYAIAALGINAVNVRSGFEQAA
jgi:hypothetical protein